MTRPGIAEGVTGETITDEQIRELRVAAQIADDRRIIKACKAALGVSRGGATAVRHARARCAAILNARARSASSP